MHRMILTLAAALPVASSLAQDLEGNVDNGKELYLAYSCYACHGYTGETARIRLNPLLFTQADFVEYLRNPPDLPGFGFGMPAYAGSDVSDQDLADVYAYIRSLPSTSPDPEDIPLLNED